MAFKPPPALTAAASDSGTLRATTTLDRSLIGGVLAGAYIAFGGLLAIVVSSGLDKAIWGSLPTLVTGAAFSVGLMMIVVAGAELATGNMATVGLATIQRKVSIGRFSLHLGVVLAGNLIGSLLVAYFLAYKTGVVTGSAPLARLGDVATLKAKTETDGQIFLRAVGCNWLVCLAVWMAMAADDIAGKLIAIFFPIMAFVAMGFDHVVANMFFLPLAVFAHVHSIGWGDVVNNWGFALLGNLVGAGVFVAGGYWYLYGRREAARAPVQAEAPEPLAPQVAREAA